MGIKTNINYPHKYLPLAQRSGLGYQHESPTLRTQLASGRFRQRRKYTSTPTEVGVTWIFNDQQSMLFESWFRDSLIDGVSWFNMRIRTPQGVGDYACRFIGIYQGPTLVGLERWQFTAALELWERPLLPPGWAEFPEFIIYSNLIDIALNKEWPE